MTSKSVLSALTIAAVGFGSKAFLDYLCADVKVVGLPRLVSELDRVHSRKGKGVLTVSNHISVMDDPLIWGILPAGHFLRAKPMRWSLGASDMCFTNPLECKERLFSKFFRQGQVLETLRGNGVGQYAVDRSIELLNQGEWVHIFPEGKISQPVHSKLRRLKWGIGRVLMETDELPKIIPMWLTGFDQVMHESRSFPRFLPRTGKRVSITFGNSDVLRDRINALRQSRGGITSGSHETAKLRATITLAVQEELEKLGTKISGPPLANENIREGK